MASSTTASGSAVYDVHWLSNDVFIAAYARPNGTNAYDSAIYAINRSATSHVYTRLPDDSEAFGTHAGLPPHRFMTSVRDWPGALRHVIFVANLASSQLPLACWGLRSPALIRSVLCDSY